ncbi:aminotransferase class I/II-fold pyridoxal phosphate-dependent enzyme [Niallia sp. 01092]|uniref:aminotransferase class I/II-fold pyridoxal phosphate-dependent enzyme n=1 Tax=unclassified Niallia TaxID=2837522 RepID=UPI003FD40C8B
MKILQKETPLYTKLAQFQQKINISFHVPGHKNGMLFPAYKEWGENLLHYDLTELTGLDDLHAPTEIILHAENLLAQLYKVKSSYFLVNGSTVGNLAMILASVQEGEGVFVQRNSHKSIMNGIRLAKAKPILLSPEYDPEWGIAATLSVATLKKAIKLYPHIKVLIITSPNYYGMVGELEEIIQLAQAHEIVVLVDEAHGAHFIGSSYFPASAVELGADIVIQSAHKTLPALTMGAYLHFNSNKIQQIKVENYLSILQSSSPSYPIMASLDIARSYIGTFKEEDGEFLIKEIDAFREELSKIDQIKVLSYKKGKGDPLKITIQSACSLNGFELQKLMEREGVYSELADTTNVLLIFPLLKKGMEYPLQQALKKIKKALQPVATNRRGMEGKSLTINIEPNIVELKLNEEEQLKREKKQVSLDEALHFISAETVVPYPPGIPLLLPGEEITLNHINHLKKLIENGAKFQGESSIYHRKITVFIR